MFKEKTICDLIKNEEWKRISKLKIEDIINYDFNKCEDCNDRYGYYSRLSHDEALKDRHLTLYKYSNVLNKYRNNKQIMLILIHFYPQVLLSINNDLLNDEDIAFEVFVNHYSYMQYISKHFTEDYNFILKVLKNAKGIDFEYISPKFRNDLSLLYLNILGYKRDYDDWKNNKQQKGYIYMAYKDFYNKYLKMTLGDEYRFEICIKKLELLLKSINFGEKLTKLHKNINFYFF